MALLSKHTVWWTVNVALSKNQYSKRTADMFKKVSSLTVLLLYLPNKLTTSRYPVYENELFDQKII